MAAAAQPKKIRTLRAYCVDTILKRVATYDVSEPQRQKGDAALMAGSGDGQLHRVTLLKALGRCELSRAFRGLPLSYAATRRFLVAAGPAKGAKVFDALRESAAHSRSGHQATWRYLNQDAILEPVDPTCSLCQP